PSPPLFRSRPAAGGCRPGLVVSGVLAIQLCGLVDVQIARLDAERPQHLHVLRIVIAWRTEVPLLSIVIRDHYLTEAVLVLNMDRIYVPNDPSTPVRVSNDHRTHLSLLTIRDTARRPMSNLSARAWWVHSPEACRRRISSTTSQVSLAR